MVGWRHRLDEHEFEQAPGGVKDREACCSPQGRKESDTAEQLKGNNDAAANGFTSSVFMAECIPLHPGTTPVHPSVDIYVVSLSWLL